MNKKKKMKQLQEMSELAAIDEAITRADSEHCAALDKNAAARRT